MVSVIIPVYNRYRMLRQAVASVLCQTYRDFELIVVDDGSTDGARNIGMEGLEPDMSAVPLVTDGGVRPTPEVEEHAPPSFTYHRVTHTGMPGLVRNHGVKVARGKYIAFLDSDDLWMPHKLELQTALMREPAAPRISHSRELWLRGGKVVSQASQRHKRDGMLFDDALQKCIIGPSTVVMERSLFVESGGFREDLEIAEDYELWLRITPDERVGYIDTPLIVKRGGHEDQLSSKYGQIEIFRIHALLELVESGYFSGGNQARATGELSRKCAIYANGARKRGKNDEAERYEALARAYGES